MIYNIYPLFQSLDVFFEILNDSILQALKRKKNNWNTARNGKIYNYQIFLWNSILLFYLIPIFWIETYGFIYHKILVLV